MKSLLLPMLLILGTHVSVFAQQASDKPVETITFDNPDTDTFQLVCQDDAGQFLVGYFPETSKAYAFNLVHESGKDYSVSNLQQTLPGTVKFNLKRKTVSFSTQSISQALSHSYYSINLNYGKKLMKLISSSTKKSYLLNCMDTKEWLEKYTQ